MARCVCALLWFSAALQVVCPRPAAAAGGVSLRRRPASPHSESAEVSAAAEFSAGAVHDATVFLSTRPNVALNEDESVVTATRGEANHTERLKQAQHADHKVESVATATRGEANHTVRLKQAQHVDHKVKARIRPAGWFGSFDEGESTYDADAVDLNSPESAAKDGFQAGRSGNAVIDFGPGTDNGDNGGMPAEWFDESKSGGPRAAWQTHFPAVNDDHPRGVANPAWKSRPSGRWEQEYEGSGLTSGASGSEQKPAAWFDTIVQQYDAFGRLKEPDESSGRMYVEWASRTKTADLKCAASGCVANATIQMYDAAKERARHCRLTVQIHPTDFDDDYSRENVEWIIVNGKVVNSKCDPMASGCNATTQAPLFPCINHYESTELLTGNQGKFDIGAKITDMVDECPMDGMLLNGVITANCYVAAKKAETAPAPPGQTETALTTPSPALDLSGTCPLNCAAANCTATCTVKVQPASLSGATSCKLSIKVNQTDFDGELGSVEQIDWLKADNKVLASDVKPGKNPCKAEAEGKPLTAAERIFAAVTDHDVTADAADGTVVVSGKISEKVDECGDNGNLLSAVAIVNCTAPAATTQATTQATTAAPR